MNILPVSEPASVRSGPSSLRSGSMRPRTESRPYLISIQPRRAGAPVQRALPLFPHESEDARLTGSTRSLFRRLLALNLPSESQQIQFTSETFMVRTETTRVEKIGPANVSSSSATSHIA